MPATITARIDKPNRSHWLELERAGNPSDPFSKEELHPILELDGVPRVGTVRAEFSADRYVASCYDEATDTSAPRWGDWRIILRDVRKPPEGDAYNGPLASGVGDATRKLIRDAGEPLIREWLESDEYAQSRRTVARHAIVRQLRDAAGRGGYALAGAEQDLQRVRPHLNEQDAEELAAAIELLERAYAIIDGEA